MTSALLLISYALVASAVGPRLLSAAGWPVRSPWLGILAWQALSTSVVTAAGLAGLVVTLGVRHVSQDVASVADLCATTLQEMYRAPGGAAVALVGASLSAGGVGKLLYTFLSLGLARRRESRRFTQLLDLVSHRDRVSGALVMDHATPYAFCLAGVAPRVVVTTALMTKLGPRQLAAVLAHESAHLRQHHHAVVFLARALSTAFGGIAPWLRLAERETAYLIELLADDAAVRSVGGRALREALAALKEMPIGAAALAASGIGVEQRVRRLDSINSPVHPLGASLVLVGLVVLVVLPLVLVAAPALPSLWHGLCAVA